MMLYLIKAAVLMTLFLMIYQLFLAKINTFQFNRFYLLLSLVFSLTASIIILPINILKLPDINKNLEKIFQSEQGLLDEAIVSAKTESLTLDKAAPNTTKQSAPTQLNKKSYFSLTSILKLSYFTGASIFFLIFLIKILSLSRLIQSNEHIKEKGLNYVLLEKDTLPFVFLNYFFVPKKTFQEKTLEKEIYIHEMAHIKQKHSLDILFVEALKIVFWFNPAIWLYKKVIQLNHEYLADKAVNDQLNNENSYQLLLLSKIAQQSTAFSLSSYINYSITKNRLKMMTIKTDKVKSIFLRSCTAALSMIVLLCFTSSVPSFQMSHMLTFDPSSEKYERTIKEALKYNDPYVLELKNLDIQNLKSAYDQMSEEERENVSEFPFLSPETFPKLMELYQASDKINVTFHYSRPITKKSIKAEVWDYWQESKKIDYEIDDVEIGSEIGNYSKEDFALYQVIEIESKGLLKKPEYLVKLTTHDYYQKKYIEVKKELNTIQADYPSGDNLNIFYFMRKASFSVNSKEVKHFPNETELFSELILQGLLLHEKKEYKSGPHHIEGPFVPTTLTRNEEKISVNIFKNSEPKLNF